VVLGADKVRVSHSPPMCDLKQPAEEATRRTAHVRERRPAKFVFVDDGAEVADGEEGSEAVAPFADVEREQRRPMAPYEWGEE
jgi:hypothetical protein